jgi:threonine dehydratase
MDLENLARAIRDAHRRLQPHVRRTPLERSPVLEAETGGGVRLKLENLQHTGSFKLRGALNRLLTLEESQRRRGVVAASSGNHGLAVARGLEILDCPGTIYLPRSAEKQKVEDLERSGVTVEIFGEDCVEAERRARVAAAEQGLLYVSPYNDPQVVAGQGTVGLEILEDDPDIDIVLAAVGGGGLVSGVAAWMKARSPRIEVVGCVPQRSPVMARAVAAGRIVDVPVGPTLSDGTAGGLEEGSITLDPCRQLVDRWIEVDEDAIASAMVLVLDRHHLVIEGAAGVAVAALRAERERFAGRNVAVIVCGGNVAAATLRRILEDRLP